MSVDPDPIEPRRPCLRPGCRGGVEFEQGTTAPAVDPLVRGECSGCYEPHLLDRTSDTYWRAIES